MHLLRVTCFILAGGWLAACSSAQQDWTRAAGQNTVPAYEVFLGKHPNSEHAGEARDRVHALRDDQAWQQADSTGTPQAYQDYLQQQPNGIHSAQARDKITSAERTAAWSSAQSSDTTAAYQAFLGKYPRGEDADQARAKLAALNGYSVKLASLKSEKEADRVRDRLKHKYGNVLHDVVVVPPSGTDKRNSVLSAPMTEDEAKGACVTLRKAHQSCEVVKAVNS
jgi:hypothetical protein